MLRRTVYFQIQRFFSLPISAAVSKEDSSSSSYILKQSQIDDIVKSIPTLSTISPDLWQTFHNIFSEYGFKTKNFIQIVTEHPTILKRNELKIRESLELWRSCQFGENRVEHLILKYPNMLDVLNDRKVQIQISGLKSMVTTNKNVWSLLMNSPNLIRENLVNIEEKFDYIKDTMRLEVPEIVKSEAFALTLDELKCRHVFLERLGVFKPRSLKAPPGEISKNPRLHQITDPDESRFATKVGLVSFAEFEAFKELFKRELDRKKKRNEDVDDSDDE